MMDARRTRKTIRYQRARRAFLARFPLCEECEREGRVEPATELDHIQPVHLRPDLFWDRSNWAALCSPHHADKTARERRREETPGQAAWRERVESMLA